MSETGWYKPHDLASMRKALESLQAAEELVSTASLALDDIPAGMAAHRGSSAPNLVSVAECQIAGAIKVLEAAIERRKKMPT